MNKPGLTLLPLALLSAFVSCQRGTDDGSGGSVVVVDAGLDVAPDVPPSECVNAADCPQVSDPCLAAVCIGGQCATLPANELGGCDDGLFCTDGDTCQSGVCVGGSVKHCLAIDSCHIGACDEALLACTNVAGNDGAQCDDLDACTYAGVCQGGVCLKGAPLDCTQLDSQCTVGVCAPGQGCVAQPSNQGADCDDGLGDPCASGKCANGTCTSVVEPDGTGCDDSLFCTTGDQCQSGVCSGDPNACAPSSDPCLVSVCQELTRSCLQVPGNNGAGCEDGNPCTTGETCSNGQCLGGAAVSNGISCSDGNACTLGTTCVNGTCANPTTTIAVCSSNDACCPAGCSPAQDGDCLYWQSGVKQNIPNASLQGWTKCYSGSYNDNGGSLAGILQACNKPKLLLACRPVNAPNWSLLAMAPRADVLFDCGSQTNCTKQSNGVGWYYSDAYSWGFAPGGLAVNRDPCDATQANQPGATQRLCWHTASQQIITGYRCGNNQLNFDPAWERAVFHAD